MARSDDHPSAAIPEADRLDQERPVDPDVEGDEQWPAAAPTAKTPEADEADQLEQAHPVLSDPEEEYTPDPG
jgi:hypothetical protein